MRVALISDIHGNAVALDAVLADIARSGVEQLVCLGDVVVNGPQPREALRRLRATGCPVVLGNTDAWLLDPQPLPYRNKDSQRINDIELWSAAQIEQTDRNYIQTFQPVITHDLGDGAALLCFHGSPHSNTDIIVATTPEEELAVRISGVHARILAGGHTHTQMIRRYKTMLIINPGSVGLPFEYLPDQPKARNPPWAEYALVTSEAGCLSIDLRRVPIDVEALLYAASTSGMPHVEWWSNGWRREF